MFLSDILFAIMLVALVGLPFLSVAPKFESFPYELFFSALGAASIVILAWERIADGRGKRLRNLMRRVYLDDGEIKLFKALRSISGAVTNSDSVPDEHRNSLSVAVAVLHQSGCYHGIDYLYPSEVLTELETLQGAVREYTVKRRDQAAEVQQILGSRQDLDSFLPGMVRGEIILREDEDGQFVPYLSDDRTRAAAYPSLTADAGRTLNDFVTNFRAKQREKGGIRSPIWRTEIIERVSNIANAFTIFLEKHGIPVPFVTSKDSVREPGVEESP